MTKYELEFLNKNKVIFITKGEKFEGENLREFLDSRDFNWQNDQDNPLLIHVHFKSFESAEMSKRKKVGN